MKKVSLLIGSGTSYFSSLPSVNDITNFIEKGVGVGAHTDSEYYLDGYQGYTHQDYLDNKITNNLLLITEIKNVIADFYELTKEEHSVNYEEIYYVIKQIVESFGKEYENPAIIKLIEFLNTRLPDHELSHLCYECISYIECMVWQHLDKRNAVNTQFNIIKSLQQSIQVMNVFSLNHDLILESFLKDNDIEYFDGFESEAGRLPLWRGFENSNQDKLKLVKLHGSIDWYSVRREDPYNDDVYIKAPMNCYVGRLDEIDDTIMAPNVGRPILLIGTFNKMLGYLSGLFENLYDEFKKSLKETNILVVSGYGFGDKGINTQIINWLNMPQSEKLIIIHPNEQSLKNYSRGAIKRVLNQNFPDIRIIEKKFEEVTIDELLASI